MTESVGNKSALYAWVAGGVAVVAFAYLSRQAPTPAPPPVGPAPSASAPPALPEPTVPEGPPTYVVAPHVQGQNLLNGLYQTEIRFTKTAGPWPPGQESTFDLWFDGDVQKEFMSRGFEDPVNFDVKTPEPKHFAIRIKTPPLDMATYVAFTFKSARPVQVLKTDVSPKSEQPARDR